jgi:hypothetical protein
MSKPATSMFVFGIYLACLGLGLVALPGIAFVLFGFPGTDGVWIRAFGMLLLFLAFFCIQSARQEVEEYFRWSVYTRTSVIVFFTAFVLLRLINPALILFGLIDLAGAVWTGLTLRSSKTTDNINVQRS